MVRTTRTTRMTRRGSRRGRTRRRRRRRRRKGAKTTENMMTAAVFPECPPGPRSRQRSWTGPTTHRFPPRQRWPPPPPPSVALAARAAAAAAAAAAGAPFGKRSRAARRVAAVHSKGAPRKPLLHVPRRRRRRRCRCRALPPRRPRAGRRDRPRLLRRSQ